MLVHQRVSSMRIYDIRKSFSNEFDSCNSHHFCKCFLHVPYVWDMLPICFPSIHFGEKKNMCSIMFNPYIFAILTELPNYVVNEYVCFFVFLSIFFLEKVVFFALRPWPEACRRAASDPWLSAWRCPPMVSAGRGDCHAASGPAASRHGKGDVKVGEAWGFDPLKIYPLVI